MAALGLISSLTQQSSLNQPIKLPSAFTISAIASSEAVRVILRVSSGLCKTFIFWKMTFDSNEVAFGMTVFFIFLLSPDPAYKRLRLAGSGPGDSSKDVPRGTVANALTDWTGFPTSDTIAEWPTGSTGHDRPLWPPLPSTPGLGNLP